MQKQIYICILVLSLLANTLQWFCTPTCNSTTKIVQVYDSVPVPGITVIDTLLLTTQHNPIPVNIDSFAIAKAFFSTNTQPITFRQAGLFELTATPTITKNKIDPYIPFTFKNLSPVATHTTTLSKVKNSLFATGSAILQSNNIGGFTINPMVGLTLITKKQTLLSAQYNPFNKSGAVGLGLKLGK